MKLIILFLTCGLVQLSAATYSQTVTLSGENLPLTDVLRAVRQQTGHTITGPEGLLDHSRAVSVSVRDMALTDFLQLVLKDQPISAEIEGRTIVLSSKEAASRALVRAFVEVRGRVVDSLGQGLAGASVRVLNSDGERTILQTKTDHSGYFVLQHVPENARLEISFVGFAAQTVAASADVGTVVLAMLPGALEEVVVSTGYQQLPKERATGSFSTVTSKHLSKQIGVLSLSEQLQAFVPGILVTNDNGITIRGKSTMRANQAPIIVIDGFPTELSLSAINPHDVESITLLRDAAAASIWGVRASNGVVVITTKKGSREAGTRWSFNSSLRVEQRPDVSSLKLANASQYIDAELEALDKGWYDLGNPNRNNGYTRIYEIYTQARNGTLTEAEAQARYAQLRNTDSYGQADLFFRNSLNQQYNIAADGNSGIHQYYLSLNYQDNQFTSKQSSDQRFKFLLRNNFQFHPKLRLEATIAAEYYKGRGNGVSIYEFATQKPYELFVDDAGEYVPRYDIERSREQILDLQSKGYYDWSTNLKRDFDNKDNTNSGISPRINLGLFYQLPAGLSFESRFVYEQNNSHSDRFMNEDTDYNRNIINLFTILQNGVPNYQIPRGTIYNASIYTMRYGTFRNQLNYTFGSAERRHQVDAILGTEISKRISTSRNDIYHNYDKEKLTHSPIDQARLAAGVTNWRGSNQSYLPIPNPFGEDENRFLSYYLNGSYTLDGKYVFSMSGRLDQSNLFGASANERITPLYSLGMAYHLSKEPWFPKGAVNRLVVRITTGENGNVDKQTSKVLTAVPSRNTYMTSDPYLRIEFPENLGLKWESTRVWNAGVDLQLWRRIAVGLDVYRRDSYDLLGFVDTDPTVGFENVYKNTARVRNSGLDLTVAATVSNGAFGWDVNLNFSYNKNKVLDVYNPNPTVANYLLGGAGREIEGQPIDYLYSYRWAGLTNTGEPTVYDDRGTVVDWDDTEAVPDISWLVYSGTTVPRYFGSLMNTFRYKRFTLTPVFVYQLGHIMRLPSPYLHANGHLLESIATRWKVPGDEAHTYVPRFPDNPNTTLIKRNDFFRSTDLRTASASFIRLENINLTYSLPNGVVGRKITGIQLHAQASNLWMWHQNDEGIDPESIDLRFSNLGLKRPALYTFGLSFQF